ncbi:zinc-binding protein A33-like [Scomber japonicus]|uniref:zinc-binding protein A33-like n=1 Tax=Scomber japonicus TaxID=13676 RepID=UPI0023058B7E|nr:zinc-binding protein A33-like [Scomber japonicus]
MAKKDSLLEHSSRLESYLSCHVCSETFKDPVSLSCNHSFCSSCLKKFWEQAKNKNCPICKRKCPEEEPRVDFALKKLADSFAGRQKAGSSKTEKREKKVEVVCSKHQEEPKLFCKDEQRALCTGCDFPHQKDHNVVPVEEVISDLRDQLKSDLKPLQDKRNKYKQVEKTYNEMIEHSKKQLLSTKKQIRAEFNKLHQFLKEEEDISAVEENLQKHNVSFLSSYKPTQTRAQSSLSDPQLVSGALIDVAKHLGNLSFRVWEKMKEEVHFSPVILDPNTASPHLCLSDDLTSVRFVGTYQQLPDNPERCNYFADVLGSEGFSSGKHSWEVEVGDHPDWTVGLAKESVDRKGKRFVSPDYGIWCLLHHSGKYTNGLGGTVTVKKSLQRIRVQLDYDMGDVSFYDPEDKTHVYTHRDIFTEKLFPFFIIGKSGNAKTTDIKIYQTEISL